MTALARSIRFALVCILLGLCYLNIRTSLTIDTLGLVFSDMLGGKRLPPRTTLILHFSSQWISISILVPLFALGTLLMRNVIHSFYSLGILALVTFVEMIILLDGLFTAFTMILKERVELLQIDASH